MNNREVNATPQEKIGVNYSTHIDTHGVGVFECNGVAYQLGMLNEDQLINYGLSKECYQNGVFLIDSEGKMIHHYGIPSNFLHYALLNEGLCPDVQNSPEGTCAQALSIELKEVPEDIYHEYLSWRIAFFESMMLLYADGGAHSNSKYRKEMELCANYLRTIAINTVGSITGSTQNSIQSIFNTNN